MVDLSPSGDFRLWKQGAEARIFRGTFLGRPAVAKHRFAKTYRHAHLDRQLTRDRLKAEVRSVARCQAIGLRTPTIYLADADSSTIVMEYLERAVTCKEYIRRWQKESTDEAGRKLERLAAKIGQILGRMHQHGVIHGDLTTSNLLVIEDDDDDDDDDVDVELVPIDFGLGFAEGSAEDKGVDLYVLERAFLSTHPNTEALFEAILAAYRKEIKNKKEWKEVQDKFEEIRMRGRKRTMVG